jgi:hypothetical protein
MGLNIKSGEAFQGTGDRNYNVVQAVFGHGPKDPAVIGKAVYEQYGVAGDESGSGAAAGGGGGFNVSSCQFSIHYMFENKLAIHNFARNVAECTCVGGFFVGTCYDGETVFQMLAAKPNGGSVSMVKDGQTILKITKRYTETGFPATPDGLGLKIDVFQESIGQTLSEYLVHYDYLVSVLSAYGIEPLAREEAQQLGFSRGGTGKFSDMFDEMNAEPAASRKGYGQASAMSREEQRVSFLNRYFVFRKRFNVDTARVFDIMTRGDGVPPDVDWAAASAANHLAANIKTAEPAGPAVTIGADLAGAPPAPPAEPEREVWPAPTTARVRIKRPPGGPPGPPGPPGAPPAAPV